MLDLDQALIKCIVQISNYHNATSIEITRIIAAEFPQF